MKIWFLPKHENLTIGKKKYCGKEEYGAISPLFNNIQYISAEVGNILSWRLIMKYFLRSFSPFSFWRKNVHITG